MAFATKAMLKWDDACLGAIYFINAEGLDFPVEGTAKTEDSITDERFFSCFVGMRKPEA